jgi:DNA-binding XRE family transcriptional regulator
MAGATEEQWRVVPGTEGIYAVSDRARVKCLKPTRIGRPMSDDGTVTAYRSPDPGNYLVVSIRVDGRQVTRPVHALMLEAFVGPRPSAEHVACFIDGDEKNVTLSNLEWRTFKVRNDSRRERGSHVQRPSQVIGGRVHYQCNLCKKWLPEKKFPPLATSLSRLGNKMSRCGLSSECRRCGVQRRMERRKRAAANGGRCPTIAEQIRPMLKEMDGRDYQPDDATAPTPGERIAACRKVCGVSQRVVAMRADIHVATMEAIEKGVNLPRPKTLAKIVAALRGVTLGEAPAADTAVRTRDS